jgi:hypothetical protein
MFDIFLLIALGFLARVIPTKGIIWLTLGYLILSIAVAAITGGSITLVALFYLLIRGVVVYFWLRILHAFQDSVLGYFIVLVVGGVILFGILPG